jgi:rSAM/selenodomain-associated transferase 2/rSAM/selenodomain-associated transferase 1
LGYGRVRYFAASMALQVGLMSAPVRRFALRIVIPVLDEGESLTERLRALQSFRKAGAEIVLVDGGSTDESWARARPWVDRLLVSAPGRASQMNAGAANTTNSHADALLFLHADTQLPADALNLIQEALRERSWGRFDVRFNSNDWRLHLVSATMNIRSRLTGIATGDQAMFIKTELFVSVGGFPDQALMEDIELSKRLDARLGAKSPPACLRQRVTTSSRKWERDGVWRTVAFMWRLRWAYFWGAAPQELALGYGYKSAPPLAPADIALLAKAAIPGLAKTRLIPLLGATGAARQQRRFTHQTLHTAQQSNLGEITLWCAPDTQHKSFRALSLHRAVSCKPQPQGDIGDRMRHCMDSHFTNAKASPLLIIGTDCAVLAPGHLQAAARSLLTHDACLIPAEDGGYVLLGLRRPIHEVFEQIDWSTERVLAQTREQLKRAGVTWDELPGLWDIDEPADWQRLQSLEGALPSRTI